jgi:mono/diheme cytochrome c family protein
MAKLLNNYVKGNKTMKTCIFLIFSITYSMKGLSFDDHLWGSDAKLPGNSICEMIKGHEVCLSDGNRKNIYDLSEAELTQAIEKGSRHVLDYPVDVTRLRLPKEAMDKFFNGDSNSPIRRFIFKITKSLTKFKSFNDVFTWLGLHEFPTTSQEIGPNYIPPMGDLEKYPMGVSRYTHQGSESLSFSCAACHSSNLFGTKVLGLTNRFPKANEAFILGKKILSKTPSAIYRMMINPSPHDYELFKDSKDAMKYVGVVRPKALGLDTSLAQVGLSLAKRGLDEYATMIPGKRARPNLLNKNPADSKPAVWWNLKYKTKWLSDGSIVSGNPVHTNFLWNEIGRGVDLKKLENWLLESTEKVRDLTAYVFHTEAPEYNDYFPNRINLDTAKRGEKLFLKSCKGCHGKYEKNWSGSNSDSLSYEELIKTKTVWYHTQSKNVNVNTDAYRRKGMKYFYKDLNRLKISKSLGTVVSPQKGYTPPPLVGVWARWPYFHNNSAPSLYEVLTPDTKRVKSYIAVPADDKNIDFDSIKNGYPEKSLIRMPYKTDKEYFYNTQIKGLSNQGHTQKMLLDDLGNEKFSHSEKLEIIEFLKTL